MRNLQNKTFLLLLFTQLKGNKNSTKIQIGRNVQVKDNWVVSVKGQQSIDQTPTNKSKGNTIQKLNSREGN